MFVRALVAVTAAALLPLAGTSHASCLDDLTAAATDPEKGYSPSPRSPYYVTGYVQRSGTANIDVHGDAAISDVSSLSLDQITKAEIVRRNAADATTAFVDCVAG